MKIIILLLSWNISFGQSLGEFYPPKYWHTNYSELHKKPPLREKSKLIRNKIMVENGDTTQGIKEIELISLHDRYIRISYDDDGSIETKETAIFIPENKMIFIYEYTISDIKYTDSTFNSYNEKDFLIESKTLAYQFDSLLGMGNSINYYGAKFNLLKIEYFKNNVFYKLDTFLYNEKGLISKIEYRNQAKKLELFVSYFWADYKLYEIQVYNNDSFMESRTLVEGNPRIKENTTVIKRYNKPWPNCFSSLQTWEIKVEKNLNPDFGRVEHHKSYHDQIHTDSALHVYDNNDRIIRIETTIVDSPTFNRTLLYEYSIVPLE